MLLTVLYHGRVVKHTKQDSLPGWLESLVFYSLAIIFVVMPFHAFLSTWGGTHIGPLWAWKSWKEFVVFAEALLVGGWLLMHPRLRRHVFRDRLWRSVIVLVVCVLVWAVLFTQPQTTRATWVGIGFDLRYWVVFFLAYCLARYGQRDAHQWVVRATRFVAYSGVVLALLGSVQVALLPREALAQFGYERGVTIAPYMTIDEKSPDIIRAFATTRGPNDYGAYLVIALAAAASLSYSWQIRLLMMAGISTGIVLSQSRSAMLAALVAWGVYAFMHIGTRVRKYIIPLLASVLVIGLAGIFAVLNSPTARLLLFHSSPHDTHLTEGNIDGHSEAVTSTLQRIVNQPLGCGPGCSGPASYYGPSPRISENYYLQLAEQYGIAGLLVWLCAALLVVRRLRRQPVTVASTWLVAAFAGLSAIGLLLHVWVDDAVAITWWLLAGATIGYSGTEHTWNTSKNNSPGKTSSSS